MKRLVLAVACLAANLVLAQEIGTEINPVTPSSGVQPQPEQVQPQGAPQRSGSSYQPRGRQGGAAEKPSWSGTKASAAEGDFGLRAGFGASGAALLPTGSGASASIAAPAVGIAYFASDSFKLLLDLGAGFVVASSNALFAASAVVGFDYMFRSPAEALRPFFHAAGFFGLAGSPSSIGFNFGAQLGFGAEYFLSPAFSLNGRLLLSVPVALPNGNFVLGVFTLSPGVGATWYL